MKKQRSDGISRSATFCALVTGVFMVMGAAQTQATAVVVQNITGDLSIANLTGSGTPTSGTSSLNIVSTAGFEYNNLGYRSTDQWLYAVQLDGTSGSVPNTNSGIVGIDPSTGATSVVDSSIGGSWQNIRLAAGDVGIDTFYAAKDDFSIPTADNKLYTVDLSGVNKGSAASLTAVEYDIIVGAGTDGKGVVFDYAFLNSGSGYLFGGDQTDGQLAMIDLSTISGGTVTRLDFAVAGLPTGVAFGAAWVDTDYNTANGANSVFLYRNSPDGNGDSIFRIDDLLGTPTLGAKWAPPTSTALVYNDGTYVPNPPNGPPIVPIPAAVWLFGSGLLCLVGIARRKKA